MAKRSTKAQENATTSLSIKFDGGLNYSQAPGNIADNELTRALNYVYNSQTGTPEVRPGTRCQTAATCDGSNPILKIYPYEKSPTESWLVGVCNGNLYYLSGASLNAWTLIGALNDTTTVPTFITFHDKLLIADGGTNIKTWDGTTYGALADGLCATAIAVIKGRVVVNSSTSGSNDLITMSGIEDETMWDTADETNPALGIRAGFGDNMIVNAFAVFGDDLIISKKGDTEKKLYTVNTADSTITNWYAKALSNNNCSQSAHTIVAAFNDVYFVDTNGLKTLSGVTQYGDLQVDLIGAKVNTIFTENNVCTEMVYLPYYTAVWYLIGDRVYTCHQIVTSDSEGSETTAHVFTDILFNQGRIRSICQFGDVIYLAGHNGYLYTLDLTGTYDTDETAPSTTSSYSSCLKTKKFSFFGGGIIKKTELYLTPIKTGVGYLYGVTPTNENVGFKTIALRSEGQSLYEATGYLNDATEYLYDMGLGPWYETSLNKCRCASIQFQVSTTSGRVGVEGLKSEIVLVNG